MMDCLRRACGGCSRLTGTYYVGIQKYLLSPYCEKRAFFPPSVGVLSRPLSPRIYIIYICAPARHAREKKSRPTAGHVGDTLWGGLVIYGRGFLRGSADIGRWSWERSGAPARGCARRVYRRCHQDARGRSPAGGGARGHSLRRRGGW